MHDVYILYSRSFDKYYTGETVDVLIRLEQHNSSFYGKSSTSYIKDWELVLRLVVENRSEALKVERYIKSMKSKAFIRKLVGDEGYLANFKAIVEKKFQIRIH
ncbi:MAG TPA: GIY-YIG nuclease family protein [Agriterribacter sp.]|nr:GIY-YIG nuclease family protein [Agriterribacter sp.]